MALSSSCALPRHSKSRKGPRGWGGRRDHGSRSSGHPTPERKARSLWQGWLRKAGTEAAWLLLLLGGGGDGCCAELRFESDLRIEI